MSTPAAQKSQPCKLQPCVDQRAQLFTQSDLVLPPLPLLFSLSLKSHTGTYCWTPSDSAVFVVQHAIWRRYGLWKETNLLVLHKWINPLIIWLRRFTSNLEKPGNFSLSERKDSAISVALHDSKRIIFCVSSICKHLILLWKNNGQRFAFYWHLTNQTSTWIIIFPHVKFEIISWFVCFFK